VLFEQAPQWWSLLCAVMLGKTSNPFYMRVFDSRVN
jgi:hypothetical protein